MLKEKLVAISERRKGNVNIVVAMAVFPIGRPVTVIFNEGAGVFVSAVVASWGMFNQRKGPRLNLLSVRWLRLPQPWTAHVHPKLYYENGFILSRKTKN